MSIATKPPNAICAKQVARLAGLTNVISALLAALPILDPSSQPDTLHTCSSMAADVVDELQKLVDCCGSPTERRDDVGHNNK